MYQIPSDNLWMLRQLQSVGYHSAVIGGGAVRDAYFEKDPHDVDIFIQHTEFSDETIHRNHAQLNKRALVDLFQLTNLKKYRNDDPMFFDWEDRDEVKFMGEHYYKDRASHVLAVWNVYNSVHETDYQVVVLNKNPAEYVAKYFDIGICMAYCDGVKMRFTDDFLKDANGHTLTICGDLSKKEYEKTLAKRVPKMKHRFPGFTVVDNLKHKAWEVEC